MSPFNKIILNGILLLCFNNSSCEYYAELYSANESLCHDVLEGYDGDNFDIINGEVVLRRVNYVFNTLSFDVVNGGNSDAFDIEVKINITTDKSEEIIESFYIDILPGGDSERITITKNMVEEYFEDYSIDIYWYE